MFEHIYFLALLVVGMTGFSLALFETLKLLPAVSEYEDTEYPNEEDE